MPARMIWLLSKSAYQRIAPKLPARQPPAVVGTAKPPRRLFRRRAPEPTAAHIAAAQVAVANYFTQEKQRKQAVRLAKMQLSNAKLGLKDKIIENPNMPPRGSFWRQFRLFFADGLLFWAMRAAPLYSPQQKHLMGCYAEHSRRFHRYITDPGPTPPLGSWDVPSPPPTITPPPPAPDNGKWEDLISDDTYH